MELGFKVGIRKVWTVVELQLETDGLGVLLSAIFEVSIGEEDIGNDRFFSELEGLVGSCGC